MSDLSCQCSIHPYIDILSLQPPLPVRFTSGPNGLVFAHGHQRISVVDSVHEMDAMDVDWVDIPSMPMKFTEYFGFLNAMEARN